MTIPSSAFRRESIIKVMKTHRALFRAFRSVAPRHGAQRLNDGSGR